MRPLSRKLVALALLAPALALATPVASLAGSHMEAASAEAPKSLYERLGGYDALAAVTDDFIGRLATDASLARFFVGHSQNSLQRIRQLVVDQLCAATGGPCVYIGRDMRTSHAGMGITKAEWDASVAHLVATLDKFQVPAKEKGEVLALVGTLEKDIVEQPAPAAGAHH